MFQSFFSKKVGSLTGVPSVRRLKTYSAQTGYVYHYFYEGCRPIRATAPTVAGTEFVFRVSAHREDGSPVSVFVPDAAIRDWEQAHAHAISSTERYAIAKMALFRAFDESSDPSLMPRDVPVHPADVETILETLGIAPD